MMLKVALLLHAQQHAKVQKNNGHHSKPQMSELYLQLMDNKLCSLKDQLKPPLWFMKTSSVTQREFTLNNHKNLLEDMPLKLLDGDLIKPVDWTIGLPITHGELHGEWTDYSGLLLDNANSIPTSLLVTILQKEIWHTFNHSNNGLRLLSQNSEKSDLYLKFSNFIQYIIILYNASTWSNNWFYNRADILKSAKTKQYSFS